MDHGIVQAEAAHLKPVDETRDKETLEREFAHLIEELTSIADRATPKRKPNTGRQASWWTSGVRDALARTRRAERHARIYKTEQAEEQLKEAQKEQTRMIRRARTQNWRKTVAEATTDPQLLWRLSKWARTQSFLPPPPACIPYLISQDGSPRAVTYEEKSAILVRRFFLRRRTDATDT